MAAFKKGVGVNLVTSLLNNRSRVKAVSAKKNGVIDRARTGDNQNHNPLRVLLFPLEITSFGAFGHDGSAI